MKFLFFYEKIVLYILSYDLQDKLFFFRDEDYK